MISSSTRSSLTRQDWAIAFGIAMFLWGFYLLTGSRERPWGDAQVMWEVAVSIVEGKGVGVRYNWPPMSHEGADGKIYSQYAIMPSIVQLPAAWLLQIIGGEDKHFRALLWPIFSHAAPSLFAAFTCGIYYLICVGWGFPRKRAVVYTFVVATGTCMWVYARYSYSESLQACCFIGTFAMLMSVATQPSVKRCIGLGMWMGVLINCKLVYGMSCFVGLLVLIGLRKWTRDELIKCSLGFLIGVVPFLIVLLAYNDARWGSFWVTGYEDTVDYTRGENLFSGLMGLMVSPGKSVFLYNPPLILGCVGMIGCWRHCRRDAVLMVAFVCPSMLVYTKFLNWSGGWCWGPRYWVFCVPVLCLGMPFLVRDVPLVWKKFEMFRRSKQWVWGAFLFMWISGCGVQVLGNAFYWDHYIRIAKQARTKWLGKPDRAGSKIPTRGRGHCDSCFEDMYHILWLPPFQPILGHFWLMENMIENRSAKEAQRNAPWRRYTSLDMNIKSTYRRARWDSWFLLWVSDHPTQRSAGVSFIFLFSSMMAVGWVMMWRNLKLNLSISKPVDDVS